MTEPMTPEERAENAIPCTCGPVRDGFHWYDCPTRYRADVEDQIHKAEQAARDDEREGCADRVQGHARTLHYAIVHPNSDSLSDETKGVLLNEASELDNLAKAIRARKEEGR